MFQVISEVHKTVLIIKQNDVYAVAKTWYGIWYVIRARVLFLSSSPLSGMKVTISTLVSNNGKQWAMRKFWN